MKKIIILIIMVSFYGFLYSQTAPETLWSTTYGGNGLDSGKCLKETSDGGYIIVGETDSYGDNGHDVLLIRTDVMGDTLWVKHYGGEGDDKGNSVVINNDDSFLITGQYEYLNTRHSDIDLYLLKVNSMGDTIWTKKIDANIFDEGIDKGYSIKKTNDNGFIITGQANINGSGGWRTNVWLLKFDQNGNLIWDKKYGRTDATDASCGYSVLQTEDSGFLIIGDYVDWNTTDSIKDVWLIRTDSSGDTLWTNKYITDANSRGRDIVKTIDSCFVITGFQRPVDSFHYDSFLIKIDSYGNQLWSKQFSSSENFLYSVDCLNDGGFLLTGQFYSDPSYSSINIIRTDNNGNTLWNKSFSWGYLGYGFDGIQDSDRNFVITAGKEEDYVDVWLIKIESDFKAKFESDLTYGYLPLEVNFTDQSNGNNLRWSWDFQNDGTYDSFEQNPTFTYTQVGVYDVKLKISNDTHVDSLIKYDYITVEYVPPAPPTDVQVDIVNPDAIISWSAVDTTIYGTPITPDGYVVLYNEIPEDEYYWFLDFTTDTTYTHTYVAQYRTQMYYEIVAINDHENETIEFIKQLANKKEKLRWVDLKKYFIK